MMRVGAARPVPFLSPSPTQIPMATATPTTPAPFRFLLPFFPAPTALSPSATTLFRCLPSPFPPIPHSNTSRIRHSQKLMVVVTAAAGSSSFRNGSAPETECPVPFEQQPVNEYQSLSNSALFSWAAGDLWTYTSRLLAMGVSFSLFVGLPVARFGIIDPERDVLRCGIGAISGGLFLVTLAALRMYLGWAYVGNRLLSATVEYEETGWYDGQIWVKTPEVLARDRLLGSYSVKPVLNRVKLTLVGLAASLVISILLFISIESPKKESISSGNGGVGAVSGVYSDASARSFEPDAFCGEPDLS